MDAIPSLELTIREGLRPRPGRLPRHRVEAMQARIARGLVTEGFSCEQVGQMLNLSTSTVVRRLASGSRPYV